MFAGKVGKIFIDYLSPYSHLNSFEGDYAPAEFFSGWYQGISGHDKQDKIHDCYEPNQAITDLLNESFQELNEHREGNEQLNRAMDLMAKALDDCS